MIKKVLIFLLKPIFGKKISQGFFSTLHYLGLRGMYYGQGAFVDESGEEFIIKKINREAEDCLTLFDVGGNIGKYTMSLHKNITKPRIIHAFEPSKITGEHFRENTKNIPQVVFNNCGLSDKEGALELYYDATASGLSSVYQRDLKHANINMNMHETIQLIRLDDYCVKNQIKQIDLLKIDVEGHEMAVFQGCGDWLTNGKIKNIQFEFGGCNVDSRTYFKDFFNLLNPHYKIFRIIKNDIFEINSYNELLEIFTTVNFFATLR